MTTVLQFSGGKDSLACLYLLKPRWDEITVVWVNTGAAFPETIDQMTAIRTLVPKFMEIQSSQSIEREGYPADVLPIASTTMGQYAEGTRSTKFQSRLACCATALWLPTQKAMKDMGASVIIRGQKRADRRTNRVPDGTVIEGVRYEFPLQDWTDADVTDFLAKRGVELPPNYRYMNTGLDCWNCTAYLDENGGKMDYMREHHPDKYHHVRAVISEMDSAIDRDCAPLRQIASAAIEAARTANP